MEMTPDIWKQVKALFESSLDLAPSARSDFLKQNCPNDELRQEVERLLENHEQAGNFLSDPIANPRIAIPREIPATDPGAALTSAGLGDAASSVAVRLGQALGNYLVISRLGEG